MIEVLALAGAVTQIAGSISSAIKAGREVSDLLPHFGKLAAARQRQQEAIDLQAKQRDRMFWGLSVVAGALVFIAGLVFMFWGLNEAVNG